MTHGYPALRLGGWRRINGHHITAVRGYFIDTNWELPAVKLGFEQGKGIHDGGPLAGVFWYVLN